MFLILWGFEVKPGCEEGFERVYGPEGEWAKLFREDTAYRGTRLARDLSRPRTYLTLDFWKSREAYEAFLEKYRAEYERLDAECEAFTSVEAPLGTFTSEAEPG